MQNEEGWVQGALSPGVSPTWWLMEPGGGFEEQREEEAGIPGGGNQAEVPRVENDLITRCRRVGEGAGWRERLSPTAGEAPHRHSLQEFSQPPQKKGANVLTQGET